MTVGGLSTLFDYSKNSCVIKVISSLELKTTLDKLYQIRKVALN